MYLLDIRFGPGNKANFPIVQNIFNTIIECNSNNPLVAYSLSIYYLVFIWFVRFFKHSVSFSMRQQQVSTSYVRICIFAFVEPCRSHKIKLEREYLYCAFLKLYLTPFTILPLYSLYSCYSDTYLVVAGFVDYIFFNY